MKQKVVFVDDKKEVTRIISITNPTAKKKYLCDKCQLVIQAGEKYQSVTGKYSQEYFIQRTCKYCLESEKDDQKKETADPSSEGQIF